MSDSLNQSRYIDISCITTMTVDYYNQMIADNIAANPRLLYMPNLEYGGLESAEKVAEKNKTILLTIPITLPVMDIVHQAEHAGVIAKPQMIRSLENGIRNAIKNCLEEEDSYDLVANDDGSVGVRNEDDVLG